MEKPIINCHTHIFTVKDVPPFIAKSIMNDVEWKSWIDQFTHLATTELGYLVVPLDN